MANAGLEMINTLIEMKLENANEDAMHAATQARTNINEQKHVRSAMRRFEDMVRSDGNDDGQADIRGDEASRIYWLAREAGVDNPTWLSSGEIGVEGADKDRADAVDAVRSSFQDRIKDLEDADKLSNFDIQDLSTRVTQAMNLQSTLTKKIDSADERVLNNIG